MKRFKFQQACLAFIMFILGVFLITGCGSNNETGHWLPAPESGKELVSIQVTPATASIPIGAPKQFIATAAYDDGTSADVTASATWTSGSTGVATVNSTSGLAAGVAEGTAIITADFGGKTDSATLTVMSAAVTLSSIVVTPDPASKPIGLTQNFVATGHYSDSSSHDISASVTWTSDTPSVATVVSPGIATGVTAGTAIITAAFGGKSGFATLTIEPATLISITIVVTPANPSIPKGTTQTFVATGTYSNGHSYDISNSVVWTSSATGVATVVSPGIATGLSVGTTTITATLDCGTCETNKSGSTTLTVTAATLMRILVTPPNASVATGSSRSFVATGYYSDGTSAIITTSVSWSSGDNLIATVALHTGVATGVSPGGPIHITATLGLVSNFGLLTVTDSSNPSTPSCQGPGPVDMGEAANFGVLVGPAGGATLSCTMPFTVNGDIGAASQSCILTQGAGFHNYTDSAAEYVAAKADMLIAISCASARSCTPGAAFNFTSAHNFGGTTLLPGVYCVDGAMSVDSTLYFDTQGVYIFRSTGALTSVASVTVAFSGSANANNTWVFWVPTGAASIGATNVFLGTIMPAADAATTLGANTTLIPGRAFSNSDVTLGGGGPSMITRPTP